jgi:hypothetical protein
MARNLFKTQEDVDRLNEMIFDVERLVFETEVVPVEDEETGKLVWVERIKGERSLYDIEMATESNPDFYSYFERDDGTIVTKFDIERRLDKIRKWVFDILREKAQGRRFQKFR